MVQENNLDVPEENTGKWDKSLETIRIAYEQMLMSWVRTAVSLFSFGFSIYKFFDGVQTDDQSTRILTPRLMGMLMILAGLLGLFCAHIEHRIGFKQLRLIYPTLPRSLTSLLSGFILCLGLVFFIAALLRQ